MLRTIRAQIALAYLLLIALATAVLSLYFSDLARDTYLADLEAQLGAEARLAADLARPLLAAGQADATIEAQTRRWGAVLGARVTIIATDGVVRGDSHEDPDTMENHASRPEVQAALAGGQGASTRYSRTLGYRMMYVAAAVPEREGAPPMGVARVALPLTEIEGRVARLRYTVAAVSLGIALLAGVVAVLVAERLARPMRRLTELTEQMARGRLGGRIQVTGRDEVSRLAGSFNRMAATVQAQIEAMDAQRSTLSAVLAHMADGVLITDRDGRVQLINPAAARLLEVDAQQAVGERFVSLVRDHQIVDLWRRCGECSDELSDTVELGRQRPLLRVVSTPLDDPSQGGCLVLLQDLTQIRRLETIRRDFVSNVSHELRTPLAALKALVDTLRDGALDDPPAAERFLNRIETEVDALTQMVQELLELSRIESGQAPLRLVPAPIDEVLHAAVDRLRPQAERSGLDLAVELPEAGARLLVLVDVDRAREVVSNLVHNAVKFTPAGGQITVSAAAAGDQVLVTVRDTGIGIPADDLPRIFERFYKADRARSGGGTGLGLAIARHIVHGHGGRIWAESVEGRGSTFYFTLPRARAA